MARKHAKFASCDQVLQISNRNDLVHRAQKKQQLIKEYNASLPLNQFRDQVRELCMQFLKWIVKDPNPEAREHASTWACACDIIKKSWIKQGIWRDRWNKGEGVPFGSWRHEGHGRVPKPKPEPQPQPRLRPRYAFSDVKLLFRQLSEDFSPLMKKKRQIMQAVADERLRAPSRPREQFTYQVKLIVDEYQRRAKPKGGDSPANPDKKADAAKIYSQACDKVRRTWVRRGIWDGKWGDLPGEYWKHERSLDEFLVEGLAQDDRVAQRRHARRRPERVHVRDRR